MAKRKRKPATKRASRTKARPSGKKKEAKKTDDRASMRVVSTEIIPANGTTLPRRNHRSLLTWFNLYMGVEAGDPQSNTFKAKKRDLEQFLDYLVTSSGTDDPDQWTKSVTESFLRHLQKKKRLAAASVNRTLATVKHAARWIHRKRPFLVGNPTSRVRNIELDEPDWRGLEDIQVNRLRSAAEQLVHIKTGANQNAVRDRAIFLVLLHTALRVSELLSLDFKQYKEGFFTNIQRKGKKVSRKLRVPKPARQALQDYVDEVRGRKTGPLIQSKNGNRLAPQNVDDALKKIAAQANSTLPKKQQIHLSAHMLRHTCLRKAAEHDIRYAMKLSGHTTSQYIWRYTEPSPSEFDQVLEGLYDQRPLTTKTRLT